MHLPLRLPINFLHKTVGQHLIPTITSALPVQQIAVLLDHLFPLLYPSLVLLQVPLPFIDPPLFTFDVLEHEGFFFDCDVVGEHFGVAGVEVYHFGQAGGGF